MNYGTKCYKPTGVFRFAAEDCEVLSRSRLFSDSDTVNDKFDPKLRLALGEMETTSPVAGSILRTVRHVATLEFSDSDVNTSSSTLSFTCPGSSRSRTGEMDLDSPSASLTLSSLEGGGRQRAESDEPTEY